MDPRQLIFIAVSYVALVLALCVHEFSHAALARWLGDTTAEDEGRLTLNPLAHVDPIGTVLFPLLGAFTGLPLFGWAKPVPIRPGAFRAGWFGRGQILVAAGGPVSNLLQAIGWVVIHAVLTRLVPLHRVLGTPLELVALFVELSVVINLLLAAFNFVPIPPLDGAAIASWGLPRHLGDRYDAVVSSMGLWLFVLAMLPVFKGHSIFGMILTPAHLLADGLLHGAFNGWPITVLDQWFRSAMGI